MNILATPAGLRPVSGPAVWHGPEMARRRDWIRPLSGAEIAELDAAVARLDATGIDIARIGPRDLAAPGLEPLVEQIRQAVLHGSGFILLRGLPWSAGASGNAPSPISASAP